MFLRNVGGNYYNIDTVRYQDDFAVNTETSSHILVLTLKYAELEDSRKQRLPTPFSSQQKITTLEAKHHNSPPTTQVNSGKYDIASSV
jgi:hypothetical protein